MVAFFADASLYQVKGQMSGTGSSVYLCTHKTSGKNLAVKIINLDCVGDLADNLHEIAVSEELRHTNILSHYVSFVQRMELWVLSPLMGHRSAAQLMQGSFPTGLPEPILACILHGVLQGLTYLHSKGVIHRAVRGKHILLGSGGEVVLSGLKYSCSVITSKRWRPKVHEFPQSAQENLYWLSPEVLQQNLDGYNDKSDIYSLGMTVYELEIGGTPYDEMAPTLMMLEKSQGLVQPLNATDPDTPSTPPPQYTPQLLQFVELCVAFDPTDRPTSHQLSAHAFIKQTKKSGLNLSDLLSSVAPYPASSQTSKVDDSSPDRDIPSGDDSWLF